MRLLNFLKKYIDKMKNEKLLENEELLDGLKKKSVDQELKILKRKKYINSDINFENKLKYKVTNYLLSRESSSFCIYWDVYIPNNEIGGYTQINNLVVTGDTIYIIESNYYIGCINIEMKNDKWRYLYNNGEIYENTNELFTSFKNIDILKKYIANDSYNFKSIIILIVEDKFYTEMNNNELIILRNDELEILFKILDKRIKSSRCEGCINEEFVSINNKLYNCMDSTKCF